MPDTATKEIDEFVRLRKLTIEFSDASAHGPGNEVCRFMLDCMDPDHAWHHIYRASAGDPYDIEEDLERGILAINRHQNPLRFHHLRHVRRFFFQRYSFCRAHRINRRILEWQPSSRRPKWLLILWLWKDVFLLRAALALLLGYALTFGAGHTSEALAALAGRSPGLPLFGAILLGFLVFLNARNQAGRITGLVLRSICVAAGTALWAVAYCWVASCIFQHIGWCWSWSAAVGVSSAAVPLSVLAQFFFGSDRSLTDPL